MTGSCGTPKGYRLHLRQGETPCAACRTANRDYERRRRAEAGERERERKRRLSPYGVIKEAQVLSRLPAEEHDEYERIQRRKRRSALAEERKARLMDKAFELHEQKHAEPRTPDNDLFLYARQIGEQMRAKEARTKEAGAP
jgi:hypothetical protein